MQAATKYVHHPTPHHGAVLASQVPGLTHTFQNHQVGARTPSPHTSTVLGRKSSLGGGRNQVTQPKGSNRKVGLFITENVDINIVFTLQVLYTWTHSNQRKAIRRPLER